MERVCEIDVNLDNLPAGAIPSLQHTIIQGDELLALFLDGATIWLRRDQANELAAKLMVHLPSDPSDTGSEKVAA